ncbi:DUF116 domain-containing protein [Methanolacinia paynteri]|uniref:DUF116 domain-containing protein n=1 Tax=Methanolacinia paynteri TaxID=230356 RepID=UPI00064EC9C4|nr:DUF116 domain-containing protein [Methanolacinia paynteri]
MLPGTELWDQFMIAIGEIAVIVFIGLFLFSLFVVALAFYSIKRGRFYFPRVLQAGLVISEGLVKAICKFFGLDDKELTAFFIRLHNAMTKSSFAAVPSNKRAIFVPQCLRHSACPANLTPEGLVCRRCGRCEIGAHIDELEDMGYMVWIAPGSTLIKRMVAKYQPEAVIGVGCLVEVKEGLEMLDKAGLIGMGVLTLKDGCVETIMNWNDLLEVAREGLPKPD